MADSRVQVVPPGAGTRLRLRAADVRIKSSAESSSGVLTCVETADPPGFVAQSHIHHTATEAFYVLEGVYEFRSGEKETSCAAGSFVFVERGAVHGYRAGDQGGRHLIMYLPAGIDQMWQEMEAATLADGHLSPSRRDDIGRKYQIEWIEDAT